MEDLRLLHDELKKMAPAQEQMLAELKRIADAQENTAQAMGAIAFVMKRWNEIGYFDSARR